MTKTGMNQKTGRPISRSGEDVVRGLWAEDDLSSPGGMYIYMTVSRDRENVSITYQEVK